MYFVEFKNFDTLTLRDHMLKMRSASTDKVRWLVWSSELEEVVAGPDITLIEAHGLHWWQLADLANSSKARQIALVGDCASNFGFPSLAVDFEMSDLSALLRQYELPDQPPFLARDARVQEFLTRQATAPMQLTSR